MNPTDAILHYRLMLGCHMLVLTTTPFRFIDDLSQDDLREKERVRPYMDELYRQHKKPSFRNGKLYLEGREVTQREIAAYLDRA